jgi:hypothetical protein
MRRPAFGGGCSFETGENAAGFDGWGDETRGRMERRSFFHALS